MSGTDGGILMYETTLGHDARRRLKTIGRADILIGVPSHRNGRTIGEVVHAIAAGIATYFPEARVVLMNADGGSSDNTVRHLLEVPTPSNVEKVISVYQGMTGKGTGIRSVFEAATELQAKACTVIEARAPGIIPEWIPSLLGPVLAGDDMAVARYQRSSYASALSENLAYPFVRTFLNADLREPLAGEFCVSGQYASELASCDVWETDVARFGVNAWIAIHSLAENKQLSQVDLGFRGDGNSGLRLPIDARFLHTAGTMFRFLTTHRRTWQQDLLARRIPFKGGRKPDLPVPRRDCVAGLIGALRNGRDRYATDWRTILTPQTADTLLELADQSAEAFDFPVDLWAQVVLEFAVVYNRGEGDPNKVAEALAPIFHGRAGAYVRSTQDLTPGQREQVVDDIALAFGRAKPQFVTHWDSCEPWFDDADRYWLM